MWLRNANHHADVCLAGPRPLAEVTNDSAHVTSGECFNDLWTVPEARRRRRRLVSSGGHGPSRFLIANPRPSWYTPVSFRALCFVGKVASCVHDLALDPRLWRTSQRYTAVRSSRPLSSKLGSAFTASATLTGLSLSTPGRESSASSLMEIPSASAIATATERTGWLCP